MNHLDNQPGGLAEGLIIMAALLGLMVAARIVVDRTLAPNDPRRRLVGQVMLYGGTALFVAIMLWLRR